MIFFKLMRKTVLFDKLRLLTYDIKRPWNVINYQVGLFKYDNKII